MKHADFVHLHVHSDFSLLDGACPVKKLAAMARQHRLPALALTDHGNLFGAVQFYRAMKDAGVRPIIGYEAYVAPGKRGERNARSAADAASHLTLLAMNETGYRNLIAMASTAYLDGFYYRPRIDKDLLAERSDGLIVLSGCNSSEICRALLRDDYDRARVLASWYRDLFGPQRFYIEIQDNGLPNQKACLGGLASLARDLDLDLVATNDIHYIEREDARAHEVLLCINTGRTLADSRRLSMETDEFYFKSPEEMYERFRGFPGAVRNTIRIAEQCHLDLRFDERHFPSYKPETGETPEQMLRRLCEEGFKRLGLEGREARERLDYELEVIIGMGFASYFLLVWDVVNFAREHEIPQWLRGSGASSLVGYCLEFTSINPLQYDLVFERFMDPERKEAPDIDVDLCQIGREKVINYVRDRYGRDNTAQIITFGTMAAKAVVRDVGRVLGISLADVNRIAGMIPTTLGIKLQEALEQEKELRDWREREPQVRELFDIALRLEGLHRHAGVHAAGMIIADRPLTDFLPLYKANDVVTSQFAMDDIEKVGMLKMDLLGLRTLTEVDQTLSLVKAKEGERLELLALPLDDEATYDLLSSGNTSNVFQLGSDGIQELLRQIRPRTLEDIIAVVALYRPGPLKAGIVAHFIARRHGRERITYPHPDMKPILEGTYGLVVYQEQIMRMCHAIGGMSLGDTLTLIKAVSKKKDEVIESRREVFTEGAIEHGLSREDAESIFNDISEFAEYGFNKSHTTAYAYLAYYTAYLKAHYPVEFVAAGLTCDMQHTEKIVKRRDDLRRMGIALLPPSVNSSDDVFTVEGDKAIRYGLGAVRNVGFGAARAVVEARRRCGAFRSLQHFCEEVDQRRVNKQALEALIKAGALDDLPGHRAQQVAGIDGAMRTGGSLQQDRRLGQATFFGAIQDTSPVEAVLPNVGEWPRLEMLAHEKEALGFYLSGHPLDEHRRLLEQLSTVDSAHMEAARDGDRAAIGGMLVEVRPVMTRRGRGMMHVDLEDLHGIVRCVAFPDAYEKHAAALTEGASVFLLGTIDKRTERPCVQIEEVIPLAVAAERLCRMLTLQVDNGKLAPDLFDRLRALLTAHHGSCPVMIRLGLDDGRRITIRVGRDLYVAYSSELRHAVDELLGVDRMELVGAR